LGMEVEVAECASGPNSGIAGRRAQLLLKQINDGLKLPYRAGNPVLVALLYDVKGLTHAHYHRGLVQPHMASLLVFDGVCTEDIHQGSLDLLSQRAEGRIAPILKGRHVNGVQLVDALSQTGNRSTHLIWREIRLPRLG